MRHLVQATALRHLASRGSGSAEEDRQPFAPLGSAALFEEEERWPGFFPLSAVERAIELLSERTPASTIQPEIAERPVPFQSRPGLGMSISDDVRITKETLDPTAPASYPEPFEQEDLQQRLELKREAERITRLMLNQRRDLAWAKAQGDEVAAQAAQQRIDELKQQLQQLNASRR